MEKLYTKQVIIRVTKEQSKQVKKAAKKLKVSEASIIRNLIDLYVRA